MIMHLLRVRATSLFPASIIAITALLALSALPQHAAPQTLAGGLVLDLDPAQSQMHWSLGSTVHTVHGTFALKKGSFQLELGSGKASGQIVVDATSGNSGNDSRDKKMHGEVLDSAHHEEIVFRPDRVEGKISDKGTCNVQVHGMFVLLGKEHELTVPVQAELAAEHWTGNAKFGVPFIDWGLKNPSNFLLKVDHVVEVDLELKGSLQRVGTP
jgi:polyisoprenoid-binding protein YceI